LWGGAKRGLVAGQSARGGGTQLSHMRTRIGVCPEYRDDTIIAEATNEGRTEGGR